ncbi:MAG: hypothetical protein KGS61_16505 [Verrucomicrobia bacterium]|nr:hypothetical protein [Verrucomicrobiota bacterium]
MKHLISTTLCLSAGCLVAAYSADAPPPPAAAVALEATRAAVAQVQLQSRNAHQQVARVTEQLERAQRALELARAQVPVALAQAQRALLLAQAQPPSAISGGVARAGVLPEAPEPPTTPAAPGQPAANLVVSGMAGGVGGMMAAGGSGISGGGGMGGGIGGGMGGGIFSASPHNLAPPLIVRVSDSNPTTLGEIQEDLSVMSRILTKALAEGESVEAQNFALGIAVSALGSDQRFQSAYLDGYGALFLLQVRMPLLPPSPVKEAQKPEAPPDTTWEQTKRELYGPPSGPGLQAQQAMRALNAMRVRFGYGGTVGTPPPQYDSEKIEALKKHLLEALKNATHIRHLKSDEWITVVVTGSGTRAAQGAESNQMLGPYLETPDGEPVPTLPNGEPDPRASLAGRWAGLRSTLTIRVRKADVDAFAKGKLSFADFQRTASIRTY